MVKKNGKSQMGTMTSDQINDAINIQNATAKTYDQYPKGSTRTTRDPKHGVDIITDVKKDPYKGISRKSKHEGSSAHGEGLDIEVNFDRKAYEKSQKD